MSDPGRRQRSSLGLLTLCGGVLLLVGASVGYGKAPAARPGPAAAVLPATAVGFLKQNCLRCHADLKAPLRPASADSFNTWVKVFDRVSAGEMPPKGAAQPTPAARQAFLAALRAPLLAADEAKVRREGRSTWRRMNRYEYENTLRDLLGAPWLQVKEMLPEDGLAARFNKVGDALDVSHVQMSRYLSAAGYALREALAQPERPATTTQRYYAREMRSFGNAAKFSVFNQSPERATFPILENAADVPALMGSAPITVGAKEPAKRELESMGVVAGAYEPLQPKFDRFRAPVAGRYRLRLRGHTFWAAPESEKRWWRPSRTEVSAGRTQEPVSLYASSPPNQLRKLGSIDLGPQSSQGELEVVMLKGETIMPDAARLFRSRPPNYHNPLATPEGQPGVAYHWLEVEGPLLEAWPTSGQRLLAGDLSLQAGSDGQVEIVPKDPVKDGERLVRAFTQRALRRPVFEADTQPFVKLFHTALETGASFTESLLTAYTGVLCSPAFITLEEQPGPLDDHALASRLAYFLWNGTPDAALRSLADRRALHDPKQLAAQTDRMLADPRAQRFLDAFLDYWLDLRKTGDSSPDEALYSDYYLDDYLTESSVAETRAFFSELVRGDLPARNLVQSDFVTINERLAALYGLPGVQGSAIRRVTLPKDSVRGGLLTQASVLKVTANGTTTSPVVRGAWITERILGQPVPPPPPAVPAVEPDIRGATTIREQLDKHRTEPTCRSCHARIDPPGFALESFDVFGGWRDRYRALGDGPKVPGYGKNGQPFIFHPAQSVDPSGELPDGRKFADVRELKRLLLQDERQIARNLTRQLVTYSTGAPARFSDRPKVEAILDRAASGGYGVKSLIHGIVASELFRNK
ncbi:MAG: hypothetical protein K0Q72_94 [Armatimonadetes bacterium]|jgi:hypothetical protein|nr:hypothetical protein [Armatimonadota bacterium]